MMRDFKMNNEPHCETLPIYSPQVNTTNSGQELCTFAPIRQVLSCCILQLPPRAGEQEHRLLPVTCVVRPQTRQIPLESFFVIDLSRKDNCILQEITRNTSFRYSIDCLLAMRWERFQLKH